MARAAVLIASCSSSAPSAWGAGFAAQLAIGKEWWVSERWGLGLKGDFTITSNKDSSAANAPTWTGYAAGVSFSATYN